ncbi:hypothetical protein HYFRA_00007151 [Hymenoscyphus fraxineus]|uniref:Uncharacterized protein n=1 Tax=Hymenoscyphus fraxineus TaxID=746836 RepID=A0A9N9KWG9_9HELO|nr:hypothetical protein HYFRA_00007151 [Hymenoscyphus fraxineus]
MVSVVTEPRGQFVTVAGHLVTVPVFVVYKVEVVSGKSSLMTVDEVGSGNSSLMTVDGFEAPDEVGSGKSSLMTVDEVGSGNSSLMTVDGFEAPDEVGSGKSSLMTVDEVGSGNSSLITVDGFEARDEVGSGKSSLMTVDGCEALDEVKVGLEVTFPYGGVKVGNLDDSVALEEDFELEELRIERLDGMAELPVDVVDRLGVAKLDTPDDFEVWRLEVTVALEELKVKFPELDELGNVETELLVWLRVGVNVRELGESTLLETAEEDKDGDTEDVVENDEALLLEEAKAVDDRLDEVTASLELVEEDDIAVLVANEAVDMLDKVETSLDEGSAVLLADDTLVIDGVAISLELADDVEIAELLVDEALVLNEVGISLELEELRIVLVTGTLDDVLNGSREDDAVDEVAEIVVDVTGQADKADGGEIPFNESLITE